MADRETEKLRNALRNCDRATLIAVAGKIGCKRADLEDVADGVAVDALLSPQALTGLLRWLEDTTLRALLMRSDVVQTVSDVEKHIPDLKLARVKAFQDGLVELTVEEKTDLLALALGTYGTDKTGKFVSPRDKPKPIIFGNTSASLPDDMLRRRAALKILSTLSIAYLETLAARVQQPPQGA